MNKKKLLGLVSKADDNIGKLYSLIRDQIGEEEECIEKYIQNLSVVDVMFRRSKHKRFVVAHKHIDGLNEIRSRVINIDFSLRRIKEEILK